LTRARVAWHSVVMRARRWIVALLVTACGSDGGGDAGTRDAASIDAGIDAATIDAGSEAGIDAAIDGGRDAGSDAGLDCPGLEEWTWVGEDFVSSANGEPPYVFAGGDWGWDVHYAAGGIRSDATHMREPGTASIRSYIDPSIPVPDGADYDAQFRSEISRRPWHEPVALGTELWIGFSYYLPPTYVQDESSRATIFQLHAGRHHPPIELAHWVPADFSNAHGTRLHIIRRWGGWDTDTFDRATLPVTFEPDRWYDFVVHVVWDVDGGTRGITQVWIDGDLHYTAEGGNTYSAGTDDGDDRLPYGGTPKLGWYKWPWHHAPAVAASAAAGVTELEMFIGAVRIIRNPEGEHIGPRGYDCVRPRGAP
jgi:hypothetical protein